VKLKDINVIFGEPGSLENRGGSVRWPEQELLPRVLRRVLEIAKVANRLVPVVWVEAWR
jgi:hypothetical protein